MNLDRYLFDLEGPSETIVTFLSHYGYEWSAFIMKDVVPTGVFSLEELGVLAEIETFMVKLFDKHHGQAGGWNHLGKKDYLKLKSLSYDYLKLNGPLRFETL